MNDSLDYQTIETHPERISKLKPYINQHNWKDIKLCYLYHIIKKK